MEIPTNNTKRQSSFLMQGMFLATASLISRVIGLVYRVPLTAIIGKTGNDYYGTAFSIYNILLIISSYSLPLAISKMIATRKADNRTKEVQKVLHLGFIFALVSGTVAFLVVFFGADFFAGEVLKTPNAAFALKILSPALIIVAILGVMRGFFQGLGTMIPSAISQIVEQILNAVVSVFAAYLLFKKGLEISEDMASSYGAGGGTLGTVSGAAAALLFMLFVLFAYNSRFKQRVAKDTKDTDSTKSLLLVLVLTIVPVLLSTTLYNLSAIVDQGIYKNIAFSMGKNPKQISEFWGVFSGQYNVVVNIPLAIANSIAASIVPSLAASYKKKENKEVRTKIRMGLRFINTFSFPCMIGFLILGSPIMQLLFNDSEASSGYMLMLGSVSVLFYSISTLTNGVLQGINKMKVPVYHATFSLILQAALLYVLMYCFDLGIYAVIIANIFYAFMMCLLNEQSVKRYTGLKISIRRTYIVPLISSMLMGIVVAIVYYFGMIIYENNTIWTISSIGVGAVSYLFIMIFMGGISESDLMRIPKGRLLIRFCKIIRVIK